MNDNYPTFPLSQYIVQGIAETVAVGTDIIQGLLAVVYLSYFYVLLLYVFDDAPYVVRRNES